MGSLGVAHFDNGLFFAPLREILILPGLASIADWRFDTLVRLILLRASV